MLNMNWKQVVLCVTLSRGILQGETLESSALLQLRKSIAAQVASASGQELLESLAASEVTGRSELGVLEGLAVSLAHGRVKVDDNTKKELREFLDVELTKIKEDLQNDPIAENECTTAFRVTQPDTARLRHETENVEIEHRECRDRLVVVDKDMRELCGGVDDFLLGFNAMLRDVIPQVPDERQAMGDWWEELQAFYDTYYPQWYEKDVVCEEADEIRQHVLHECNDFQGIYENNFCAYRAHKKYVCSSFKSCEEDLLLKANQGSAEHRRRVEWEAVLRIECYAEVLLSNDTTAAQEQMNIALQECDALTGPCNLEAVKSYPCTEDFVSMRYNGLLDVNECVPCDELYTEDNPSECSWRHLRMCPLGDVPLSRDPKMDSKCGDFFNPLSSTGYCECSDGSMTYLHCNRDVPLAARTCHTACTFVAESEYYQLDYRTGACPPELVIMDMSECQKALESLGYVTEGYEKFSYNFSSDFQVGCSRMLGNPTAAMVLNEATNETHPPCMGKESVCHGVTVCKKSGQNVLAL